MKYILLIGFSLYFGYAVGQTYPNPPVVQRVSVNPLSDTVYIQWTRSASADVKMYYIIQMADNKPYGYTSPYADSVDYTKNSATFAYDSVKYKPVWFNVIAKNALGNLSQGAYLADSSHRTVFLRGVYDTCSSMVHFTWNKYVGWQNQLSKYILREIVNNSNPVDINDNIPANDTTYSVFAGGNQTHCYYLVAVKDNGSTTSTSYRACVTSKQTGLPSYINGNFSNFNSSGSVDLQFSVDPGSQITKYLLMRSSSPQGNFVPVQTLTNIQGNIVTATDTINTTMYYQLEPVNNCNVPSAIPNLITAMVPSYTQNNSTIRLTWPTYSGWNQGVGHYNIYRESGGSSSFINTGTVASGQPTNYTDDISSLMGQHYQGNLCYYIEAVSNADTSGKIYSSRSATLCIDLASQIFIPNAFTPNGDGKNDVFKAFFAFDPSTFHMILYNRAGGIVFETSDPSEGWDGRLRNGSRAPQGVYIYFISFDSSNGTRVDKKGSLSLIYP